jgi:uncharacterized protein
MPATLAQKARERRDIVSGEVMEEVRLVRFVAAPGGQVVPDVGRKLPGRGLWVAADRASVDIAVKKNLFARAARTALSPQADLADQVAALLHRKLLAALGLARKAGDLTFGFERVLSAISSGKAAFLVEAQDGAADGRRKLLAASRRSPNAPRLIGLFASGELGLALGGETVIHTAFLAGRGADRWADDVGRISGFRPLVPERWREEP